MTVLSGPEAAAYWEAAGGPSDRAVEWVAIGIGESSLDDQAVSPAGAIGWLQIMPFNASIGGGTVSNLYDPEYNARVAVIMSGGGTNCAAWDSCYRDIYASGRYSFLGWPEVGSADYNNLPTAAAMLGTHVTVHIGDPHQPGMDNTLSGAVADIDTISGQLYPPLTRRTQATVLAARHAYRKGWRP